MVERSGDAPSGTVAFLFTDIEGSTRLWEEVPEAMQVSLERHDAIVFGTFERLGGYIFSSGGDGYGVSFARAGDALEAATTIQAELAAVEWGDAPIKVRMGLHVGEAEERNGDYFGQSVNRAARVGSAGHGGQLLATRAFVELVEPPTVVDLGEHRLRDLTAGQPGPR